MFIMLMAMNGWLVSVTIHYGVVSETIHYLCVLVAGVLSRRHTNNIAI